MGASFAVKMRVATLLLIAGFVLLDTRAWAELRHALFISSYHPAFHSFDQQVEGLREGLRRSGSPGSNAMLDVEFMDTKRFPDAENVASFRSRLAMKLSRRQRPNVLIVGDDNAFNFALEERDRLFADLPIVFLGVNNVDRALAQNSDPRVTGVVEKPSIEQTLSLAAGLIAPAGRVHAIVDDSTTGHLNRQLLESAPTFKEMRDRIDIMSLETQSFSELGVAIRAIEPGSILLLVSAFRDNQGTVISSREAAELITENARVPFLHPWESTLGYGALGGVVVSHKQQGRVAGTMAAKILDGRDPASIPVVEESPNPTIVDHAVLASFGLKLDDIPNHAMILNAPLGFYREYQTWIWLAGGFIVLQSGIIVVLVMVHRRRRQAEKALKAGEARFRDFADVSSDYFWEMDKDLRFSYFSDRFEGVTGLNQNVLLGKTREETGIPNVDPTAWVNHLTALHDHEPFRDFVHPRQKNGDTVWISVSGRPLFDEAGNFKGFRGTGSDITERRRAEEARSKALQDAERANQAKTEFLATMSHEFRTPLNAILGFSDILRAQYFGPLGSDRYENYANDIHGSGKHMLALINDILDISAIEAGKREMEKENINLHDLLKECLRNVEHTAREGQITVALDVTEDLPTLYADRRAVVQIVLNLLSNAIKFTPSGGSVRVAAQFEAECFLIAISDTGIGIAPDRLPDITEPFSQSHTDPHLAKEGTGLGLSIVRSLINAHDGKLAIDSIVQKGTTVTVRLPVAEQSRQRNTG